MTLESRSLNCWSPKRYPSIIGYERYIGGREEKDDRQCWYAILPEKNAG